MEQTYKVGELSPGDRAVIERLLGRSLQEGEVVRVSAEAFSAAAPGETLSEFLMNSPLAGSELDLHRDSEPARTVRL